MPDRLTGIEVFVQAIRSDSLSAAARSLKISPAMASRHLDALEHRLGVTLVRRTTRRLSLTEAGSQFLNDAERLLGELAEAEAAASALTVAAVGLLRVSAPVSFGVLHIAPLIPGFSKLYPKVTIELGLNDRYVDLLEESWDVAIRIGGLISRNLIARKLATTSPVICASPAYLEAFGTPRTLADLCRHQCLGYTLTQTAGTKTWSFGVDDEVVVPVQGNLHANNGEALVAACIAGQGLVYSPYFIAAPALADGRLVEVKLDVPPTTLGAIYAVTHSDRRPTAKTRAWIKYLADELPGRVI